MKRILPLLIFLLTGAYSHGQGLSATQLITAVSMPLSKSDNYILQKGFTRAGTDHEKDTLVHSFYFRGKRRNQKDTTIRSLRQFVAKDGMTILYETASPVEFQEIRKQLNKEGYSCRLFSDSLCATSTPLVFQHRDIAVHTGVSFEDDTLYSIKIHRKYLPGLKEILFGEDLLNFQSHEQLVHVFGTGAVKKDLYYFSEKEFSRCSVLFPNTDKQAVFIWQDEMNDCGLSYLVIGGQLMLESTRDYTLPVAENTWMLKSQLRAGMNLRELRRLNGLDFSFYSVRSKYSGMVLPETSGKIDFQKEGVVLACMNCTDLGTPDQSTMTADEALRQGRSFFVFSIMLYPNGLAAK